MRAQFQRAAQGIGDELAAMKPNPLTQARFNRLKFELETLGDSSERQLQYIPIPALTKHRGIATIHEHGLNYLPPYFEQKIRKASKEAKAQFKDLYEVRLTPENFGKAVRGMLFSMELAALLSTKTQETDTNIRFDENVLPESKYSAVSSLLRAIHPEWTSRGEERTTAMIHERLALLKELRQSYAIGDNELLKTAFSRQLAVCKKLGFDLDFLQEHFGIHTVEEIMDLAEEGDIPTTLEQRELLAIFLHHDDIPIRRNDDRVVKRATGMILIPEVTATMGLFGFETWRSIAVGTSWAGLGGVAGHDNNLSPEVVGILHHLGNDQDLASIAVLVSTLTAGLLAGTKVGTRLGPKITAEIIQDVGLISGLAGVILYKIIENPTNVDFADIFGSTPSIAVMKIATMLASKTLDRITIMRFNRKLKREKQEQGKER